MKAPVTSRNLSLLAISAGLLCAVMRFFLYAFGFDHRGLMNNSHFLHIGCWIIAIGLGVYIALTVRKLEGSNAYEDNFLPNKQWAAVAVLVPLWFLAGAFVTLDQITDRLTFARTVLAFAAVPCFAVTCWCRIRGKRPSFLLHGIICVFFAVDIICRYRPWSGNPQLADYTFHLMACIFLTLTAYYRTAFDVDLGSRRMFLVCSLMAVFFCVGTLAGPEDVRFYIGGILWALSGMCPAEPAVSLRSPEAQKEE